MQTELLLELVFSASNIVDENEILKKSIPLYLRKLNCLLAGVLKNDNDGPEEVMVMPYIAKESADWKRVSNYFKYKIPRESEPCLNTEFGDFFYYAFSLEKYGLLILGRKKEFNAEFTHELKPVVDHLGKALIRAKEIDQRKKAEQSLIESEQRLKALSHTIPVGIFIYNNTNIVFANPSAEVHTGYRNEELLKLNFNNLVHTDFKALLAQDHSTGKFEKQQLEIKINCKDKSVKWLEITKDVIQWKGEYATIVSSFDITRRKKAEERLRESEQRLNLSLVVNKASVFENNFETGEVITTPDLYYSLGYLQSDIPTNVDELIDFVHPDDVQVVTDTIEKYFNGETTEYYAEFRMKRKGGRYVWINGRGRIVQRNEKGEPTVLLGISQDISKRKQVEDELLLAKEKAEESDRLKSAFLANMSHEIRTPLNSIIGFAQLLNDETIGWHERHEYLHLIEQSGVRMLSIINDLIDISKVEAGQMEVMQGNVDINEHIEYIYKIFKPEVEKNGVKIEYSLPLVNGKAKLNTDSEKLYAVLTNLVKNAVKFTENGSIKIGYIPKNDIVEFFVKDSGAGIPEDQINTVFDRFIMGSQPLNKNYQGSGLGLSISKAYVELLGGEIWVESTVGEGASFYFTLPIK